MPYQDIPGTEVEYVASFGSHNQAIGRLWKEAITDFLLTAARETKKGDLGLAFQVAWGMKASIIQDNRDIYLCARGSLGREHPTFEPSETLYSRCVPESVKSGLFDFVHGPRRMLVIDFSDSRLGWWSGNFINKLYLWKSPKDRVLHVAAEYKR